MNNVRLIRPLYSKEVECPIGFSRELLLQGPFSLMKKKNFKSAALHILFSFITFGYYWYWFAKNHNKNVVIKLLSKGWKPATKKDEAILRDHNIKKIASDSGHVGISRMGSVDHRMGDS